MKILICSANYAPELTGVGRYSGEMAEWLAAQGHEVRVVAAPPYYPAWRVADAYRGRPYCRETIKGVHIWRAPLWVPSKPGGLPRVLHLLSFALSSAPLLLWWGLTWRPQVCLVVAPFFTAAPAMLVSAALAGGRSWLHVQDYEIDVAFGMGLLKGGVLKRAVMAAERFLFRRFDRVSSISQRMLERAASKGVASDRLVLFRNWVDIDAIRPLNRPSEYRRKLGLADDAVVALFSGTLGSKQGLRLIPEVARLLADEPRIQFVICGDGPMKAELQRLGQGLPNLRFLPLQPRERLGELLGLADIHLLTQDAAAEDLVLPSKLGGMLASGRPVVATCALGTEMASVVSPCGSIVLPGDIAGFRCALLAFVNDVNGRLLAGRLARLQAEDTMSSSRVLRRFAGETESLAGAG